MIEQYFQFEKLYDGGRVVVTNDPQYGLWVPVAPRGDYPMTPLAFSNFQWPNHAFTGGLRGWHRCTFDLGPALASRFAGRTFYLGFEIASDDSNLQPCAGWYIDDVRILAR